MVAIAICGNCAVLEACRDQAIHASFPPQRGIIAGTSARKVKQARAWRRYEQGITDTPPRGDRPAWLPMTDATNGVEQFRIEQDPEEST